MWPYLTFHNKIILTVLLTLALSSLLSPDPLIVWFILEMSTFMFMALMILNMSNKKIIFLFFITQAVASLLMIITISSSFLPNPPLMASNMLFLALLIKMGIPPLHTWLPIVSSYMDWTAIFMLFSVQKLIPFMMMSLYNVTPMMMTLSIITCMMIPPFLMSNSANFKKLLTYSSMNQSGWMIMMTFISPMVWLTYLLIYSISLLSTLSLILMNKVTKIKKTKTELFMKTIMIMTMMNMASLPPFSFFMMKWYSTILIVLHTKMSIIIILMLISSLIMMMMYMLMMIKISMIKITESKMMIKTPPHLGPPSSWLFMMMTLSPMIIMLLDFKLKKL